MIVVCTKAQKQWSGGVHSLNWSLHVKTGVISTFYSHSSKMSLSSLLLRLKVTLRSYLMYYRIVFLSPLGYYAKLPYLVFGYRLPAACTQAKTLKSSNSTLFKKKNLLPRGGVPTDVSDTVYQNETFGAKLSDGTIVNSQKF